MTEVPRRVAVTSPRTRAARRSAPVALDEQDAVRDLLVRSLMRAQLQLGLGVAVVLGCLLGGLPVLFAAVPRTRDAAVLGVRLPWLVLGVLVYPSIALAGWLYVRLAERHEHDVAEILERS